MGMTTSQSVQRKNIDPQPSQQRKRVVIVGAGFGGLRAAHTLGNSDVDVLILDRNNYHGFWPLLYQVATAGLEPEATAYPIRAIIRKYPNVAFLMTEVHAVDLVDKQVITSRGRISYDYLILAAGSANNFFGNAALAEHTYGLKDIDDAEQIRNHILAAFEQVTSEPDPERRRALMTFAIIGGGPTGVELAGAFIELIRHVLRKDYPMLDVAEARVVLIEALPQLLAPFPESLQRAAHERLERMGVEVRLNAAVDTVSGDVVQFKDGTDLRTSTVIWAAGVRAPDLANTLGVEQGRGGRVKITPTLNLSERPEVFVIGDMAYLEGYRKGAAFPMVAPVAIQMGEQAARNILALAKGRQPRGFRYTDKGQMATIGRRAAVMDSFGLRIDGRLAWFGWLLVHLIQLVGFRNRVIVLANWAYNYITYDRGVRLITRADCQLQDETLEPVTQADERVHKKTVGTL